MLQFWGLKAFVAAATRRRHKHSPSGLDLLLLFAYRPACSTQPADTRECVQPSAEKRCVPNVFSGVVRANALAPIRAVLQMVQEAALGVSQLLKPRCSRRSHLEWFSSVVLCIAARMHRSSLRTSDTEPTKYSGQGWANRHT